MGVDCCCERNDNQGALKNTSKIQLLSDANLLCDLYDTFIFDLDGTVWHDKKPIPGILDSIHKLITKHNKKVLFYTNGG